MPFDRTHRLATLRELAASYVDVALNNIIREYPVFPFFIATGPGPYPTHRESHPAFFGSFDWHSCVEMHWVIVRLLRLFPDTTPGDTARATLGELLTPENIAAEVAFYDDPNHRSLERPYGFAWLLTLAHELETWDDPDARRWSTIVTPLAELLTNNLVGWLPILTYPHRNGVHSNTAFSLSLCSDYAQLQANRGDDRLMSVIKSSVDRWFIDDTDYPAHYEPSGADFLSAALCEAELVSRILPPVEFPNWLHRFLPGLADEQPAILFNPAVVSDSSDGHIGHLHGLNLSRAWAFSVLAERLPAGDPRISPLLTAAERHAEASLPYVAGSDYMVEHWLAVYATLLLS